MKLSNKGKTVLDMQLPIQPVGSSVALYVDFYLSFEVGDTVKASVVDHHNLWMKGVVVYYTPESSMLAMSVIEAKGVGSDLYDHFKVQLVSKGKQSLWSKVKAFFK